MADGFVVSEQDRCAQVRIRHLCSEVGDAAPVIVSADRPASGRERACSPLVVERSGHAPVETGHARHELEERALPGRLARRPPPALGSRRRRRLPDPFGTARLGAVGGLLALGQDDEHLVDLRDEWQSPGNGNCRPGPTAPQPDPQPRHPERPRVA